jgi:predicted exporter
MEVLELILLTLHLLGFGALFGGLFIQLREPAKKVNSAMRDGAGTVVVAGFALYGVLQAKNAHLDASKFGVKMLIGIIVLALVMMNLKKPQISNAIYYTILGLTVANVCVALFWHPVHGHY